MNGFDVAAPVGDRAAEIKAAGYDFVARYYSYNPRKNLHMAEAEALSAVGLSIIVVFEALVNVYASFDARHGADDAAQAMKLADENVQPTGSAIYFAVDFDASPDELGRYVTPYFAAVKIGLRREAGRYRVGVYGSGLTCKTLREAGLAELFWLADAGGWRGTKGFVGAHIVQGMPSHPFPGISADPDIAADGDVGQWSLEAAAPVVTAPPDPPAPAAPDPIVAGMEDVQRALTASGDYHGPIDADPGKGTRQAMHDYRLRVGV